jgi:toxin ParE1/3/4
VPKPRYRLTKLAAADYAAILRFTLKRWAKEQLAAYNGLLDSGIVAVAHEPKRLNSHSRDDLRPGFRSFNIGLLGTHLRLGRHVIYYRIVDDGVVEVLRILHDRMEVSSKLP